LPLAVLLGVVGYHVLHWRIPGSSEALLEQADEESWVNNWIAAEPLYRQAELGFIRKHELSKALYAHVSEIPAQSESSISVPAQLADLTADLSSPQARDPKTRLRILTILGMLEVNYDSAMARATWAQVEYLARQRHHYSPQGQLAGNAATETRFKRLPLSQYNVLHLALHGYADMEYSDRSALVFAPEEHGTDHGLLQIREIRSLHLKANLVTLSACDTGVGPVGEEGIANIVNAFVEAGAQTVVSTLWELEDHSTAHLMTVFYEHLGHAEEKGESLRNAQLQMIASGDPPYFWAGFEVVGDPDWQLVQ
jgi:CHAT domain-containing protein